MKEIEAFINKETMQRRRGMKKELPDKEYYKLLLLKAIYDKLCEVTATDIITKEVV